MWIKKCNKYFSLCKIHDEQKVDLACLNMVDKAESWMSSYIVVKKNVDWSEFIINVAARFKDDNGCNVVKRFNKLSQTGSIESYIDDFEELRSLMLQQNHVLPDSYFLDSFVGGLKPTVRPFVKAFKPTTFTQAIEFSRLQEENLEATNTISKTSFPFKPYSKSQSLPPLLPTPSTSFKPFTNSKPPSFSTPQTTLTAVERREKQLKGLCYFCDKPYEKGHKCQLKQAQLFLVEIPGVGEELKDSDREEEEAEYEHVGQKLELSEISSCISINALSGSHNFQTMRVNGVCNGKTLHILIDSGSTHNFLDLSLAKTIGLDLETINPQAITVADGNHLACQNVCRNFTWKMQGTNYSSDMLLIPLGSCDMVLEVQWLSGLGTVKWDFKKLIMEFDFGNKHHVLKGIPPAGVTTSTGQKAMVNSIQLFFMQLKVDKEETLQIFNAESRELPPPIYDLLQKYKPVFEEPNSLPPSRDLYDHRIPLEFGTNPVNIRPYRYPLKQRDIIEKLVTEMLAQGIIRDSNSPFASPVVLVGKKDGSWRLCVDYRELNRKIIKDKFPIPVVDELIDELAGSTVFSKMDLRAGYH
ncbi:Transposon Ty3-I Gag-Pol polyprotein [Bienertia sinuspersici]